MIRIVVHDDGGPGEPQDRYDVPPAPGPVEPEPPHWSLWFVYLVLRPRLFFETFVIRSIPALTVLTAGLYGVAGAIDRIETRILLSGSDNPLYDVLRQNWGSYALFVVATGLIGGALYYSIGGWWYGVRLRWSGDAQPDTQLVRRVYLYSAQAYAVPMVLYTAWEATVYASPSQAAAGDDWGWVLILAGLFWSVYVSYRGVRTAFEVRRWPARVWFLLLPGLAYTASVSAIMAAVFFAGAQLERPPDVERPNRIERAGFVLEYPGNWAIDRTEEDYDLDANFVIGPPLADAGLRFWFYTEPMDSEECVEVTVQNLSAAFELSELSPVEQWGSFEGAGYRGVARIEGRPYDVLAFCSTERERPFEILQITEQGALAKLRPGYDLIRDTLQLLPVASREPS